MFNYHSLIPWGSFRGRQEEKWGSFRGWDHFGVDLRIISGLGIISGSGSFRGLYRPQSICEGDNMWNLPVLCIRKPKVNYAGVNLIINQLSEVKLRIKQFYYNILTKRESNKITQRIIVKEGA